MRVNISFFSIHIDIMTQYDTFNRNCGLPNVKKSTQFNFFIRQTALVVANLVL